MPERIISEYNVNTHPIKIVFNDDDLSLAIYAGEDKIDLPYWGIACSIATQLLGHVPEMKKVETVKKLVKTGGDAEEIDFILSKLTEFRNAP